MLCQLQYAALFLGILISVQQASRAEDSGLPHRAAANSHGLKARGRRLCHGQQPREILDYWHNQIAQWPAGEHSEVVREFERRFKDVGGQLSIETPADNEKFLAMYYFLRNTSRHQVIPAAGWERSKSKCAPGCTDHGTCNEELGRCDCPRGRKGSDCSEVWPEMTCSKTCMNYHCMSVARPMCVNNCNNRGTCVSQFCHCYPGYFGTDCSLSLHPQTGQPELLAGRNYTAHPRGPRVYVYEMPPKFNVWFLFWVDRPVGIILWERFLSQGMRVATPEEADFFFVPVLHRGCVHWSEPLDYMQSTWGKYVERKQARDHIIMAMGDWGRSEQKWHEKHEALIRRMLVMQIYARTLDLSADFGHGFRPSYVYNHDIAVPSIHGDQIRMFETGPYAPFAVHNRIHPNRTVLAMLAGGICGWRSSQPPPCGHDRRSYSLGVREQLYIMFHGKKDFVVDMQVPDQGAEMLRTRYCFSPVGAGGGKRQSMVAVMGCIPVLISDGIVQPFQPFLDWPTFSVNISQADINATEAILRAIPPDKEEALRSNLRCASRHMTFQSAQGRFIEHDDGRFDAINTIVEILRMRVKHPGVPDDQYVKVDRDFADFIACKETAANTPLYTPPLELLNHPTPDASARRPREGGAVQAIGSSAGAQAASLSDPWGPRPLCYSRHHHPLLVWPNMTDVRFCAENHPRPGGLAPGSAVMCPLDASRLTSCMRYA